MRNGLLLFCALLILTATASADTTWVAAGNVSGNWIAAHSPYMIQGTITVPTDSGLLIGPGVRVFFTGPYYLRIDSAAHFSALGATGDSVVFTTDTLANPQRWYGIRKSGRSLDTLRFGYCVLEYMGQYSQVEECDFSYSNVSISHTTVRFNRREVSALCFGGCRVTLDSCRLAYNYTMVECGALAFFGGRVDIVGCEFLENEGNYSGGLTADGSIFQVINTRFIRNRSRTNGGACELMSDGSFFACTFEENQASDDGGAVSVAPSDSVWFSGCTFRDNQAMGWGGGGAIWAVQARGAFTQCVFEGNRASSGGAIYCAHAEWAEDFEFIGCRFTGNSATEAGGVLCGDARSVWSYCVLDSNHAPLGGAINTRSWDFRMDHCTVVANSAADTGSILSILTGQGYWNIELQNSLFANSSGASCLAWSEDSDSSYGYPVLHPDSIHHNLFFANAGGNTSATAPGFGAPIMLNANGDSCDAFHNLYLDPRFVDLSAGDYHLLATSPCIDAGDPASPPDSDGTVADIGAYSSPYLPDAVKPLPVILHPSAFRLSAFPNPFNVTTVLQYELPHAAAVTLKIYNLLGEEVTTLVDGRIAAGRYHVNWDAGTAASGTYLAVLQADGCRHIQKLLLLK